MVLIAAGCSGGPSQPPLPPVLERTVIWTWEPGDCTTAYRLFEVIDAQHRLVVEVTTPTYTTRMVPRRSVWIVSGVCDDGSQYFSEPALM